MDPDLHRGDDISLGLLTFATLNGNGIPMKQPCVYILASGRRGTLYIGVTSDLLGRVWQHKSHCVPGFTARYNVTELVWYQSHPTMESAITCEKRIKEWRREWKIRLIEELNPEWRDLYEQII